MEDFCWPFFLLHGNRFFSPIFFILCVGPPISSGNNDGAFISRPRTKGKLGGVRNVLNLPPKKMLQTGVDLSVPPE
jgi:hypothetical protein